YTNAVPKEHSADNEIWENLEDFILSRDDNSSRRVSMLTGPILRQDDPFYHGVQAPSSFWKIMIYKRADGSLSVSGFIVEFAPSSAENDHVFQCSVAMIEKLTNLNFGNLHSLDKMSSIEPTSRSLMRSLLREQDIVF
ncbi:DNA/RNA non-specific endonuclease, partial [Agrobacterium tumefaciens]|uniref:DNA/RNA non-specific endonuclease n=1 Tax=Agrobacterium tumefaciens TaxID=358 RepID=UPI001572EFA0